MEINDIKNIIGITEFNDLVMKGSDNTISNIVRPYVTITVKYHGKDLIPIEMNDKSDWIDLRSAENVSLKKGDVYHIRLGISVELPPGTEAWIAPRSSTAINFGLLSLCTPGIIDNSYRGNDDEWHFPVMALWNTTIHKNDRICQFRIMANQPDVRIITTEYLDNPNRGGIGSSGKR